MAAWWLRQRAPLVIAALGIVGAVLIGLLVWLLCLLSTYPFVMTQPPTPAQQNALALKTTLGLVGVAGALGFIGFLHSLQLQEGNRNRQLWFGATLALCAEVGLGALLTFIWAMTLRGIFRALASDWRNDVMLVSYAVTLGVLALFRPWFLKLWRVAMRPLFEQAKSP